VQFAVRARRVQLAVQKGAARSSCKLMSRGWMAGGRSWGGWRVRWGSGIGELEDASEVVCRRNEGAVGARAL